MTLSERVVELNSEIGDLRIRIADLESSFAERVKLERAAALRPISEEIREWNHNFHLKSDVEVHNDKGCKRCRIEALIPASDRMALEQHDRDERDKLVADRDRIWEQACAMAFGAFSWDSTEGSIEQAVVKYHKSAEDVDKLVAEARLSEFDLIVKERPANPTYWDMHHREELLAALEGGKK